MLVQVKRNQPTLFDTLTDWAQCAPAAQTHCTSDSGRSNRIESRKASVWTLPKCVVAQLQDWPGIICLIRVEHCTDLFNPAQNTWTTRAETAWHICTRVRSAEQANTMVRHHWAIENSLHYVRDVVLQEDASRIRKQPGIFARLRSWALNLIRHDGKSNVQAARQTFGRDVQAAWDCLNSA